MIDALTGFYARKQGIAKKNMGHIKARATTQPGIMAESISKGRR